MKTAEEYVASLRKMRWRAYFFGKRIESPADFEIIKPSQNSVALTYQLAHEARYSDLMTATSHLTGNRINRFTHIPQNREDLVKKVKMLRLLGQKTGSCFQRCAGLDALITMSSITYDLDKKYDTEYRANYNRFLEYVQNEDLVCNAAMTDVKGDRSLKPSQQADPDLYLRIVKRTEDGIIVRGAKAHQTGALNAHEIVVMPTITMDENERDYAVSFAIPSDSEGLIHVIGRQANDTRKLEGGSIDAGNPTYGVSGHEALVVFDNVFVPADRVFMCGEHEFTGTLIERFTSYHRQNYGGCKVGVGDVLIGSASTIAQYNGVERASHTRDKITEMVHLNETMYACGLACSYEGTKLPSGDYIVNPLLANVTKQNVTRFPFEMARLATDIAGGAVGTLPSEKDLMNPETAKYLEKYLKAKADVRTEDRVRILRLIENMVLGVGLVEALHGAGSPQAQRVMILRQADLEEKKKLSQQLAGVKTTDSSV
ncbi:MAG TPA: 4-hydroxyphenylacetate 3-hydroxylase family protein [Methylomirabilota bacterium]|nr:4-hydroxyphenylacetate 3-hydroxylase family protein [Methylomirabilota bacterium]